MARQKSTLDLYKQYRRILDGLTERNPRLSGVESRRLIKTLGAYKKYVRNIGQQKAMQNYWDENKKYSRATYMGLANNGG